jgi:ABC-2 type transport system permease protein
MSIGMGILVVLRRELKAYLTTPFTYWITAAVLVVTGVLFAVDLQDAVGVRAPSPFLVPQSFSFLIIFFAPLITMRLLAEERREGTMELLLTAPVSDFSIVVGKYLGAWTFYTGVLALTLSYQVIVASLGTPDLGHTVAAYIGIWLYGGAALAVGLVFSAITENQIVAAFLGMVALLLLWLGDNIGLIVRDVALARIIRELTLQGHFSSTFAAGFVRAEDVAYYAGLIVVMLFVAVRCVEAQRWQ